MRKPFAAKSKLARSLKDVHGIAAVARYATGDPQLLERNPCSVVSQDDCQRSGAALNRLHLKNGGGAWHRLTGEQGTQQPERGIL